MDKSKLLINSIIGLLLYLVATGGSYAFFRFTKPAGQNAGNNPIGQPTEGFNVDPSLPKTEECVINGAMYSVPERQMWEKRRPLAAMVENHADSRPQSGLSKADVVYEAVAEGGITRFMGIFYCGVAEDTELAPVRSARTYFLPWVLEYDALYNHVGGAGRCNDSTVDERAKALCQIEQYKIKDMDQFSISFPTCYRNYDRLDHPVATEHTMVCATEKLFNLASQRGWTETDSTGTKWDDNFRSWKFKDDAPTGDRGSSFSASFVAWDGYNNEYGVIWDYDPKTNRFIRSNGGVVHKDLNTDKPLTASAVIIQFAKETGPVDGHMHLLYQNIGNGNGILMQDGKHTPITWKKATRSDRTLFYDQNGKEVVFTRGQIWIELLPTGTDVEFVP